MLALRNSALAKRSGQGSHETLRGVSAFFDHFIRCVISLLFTPQAYTHLLYPVLQFARKRMPRLYHLVEPRGNDPAYRFDVASRAPFKPHMALMIQRQLERLEVQIARRRAIAQAFKVRLEGLDGVRLLNEDQCGRSNGAYFGLYVPDPEALAVQLERQGILSDPHEYYDCSRLPQFADYTTRCEWAAYADAHLLRIPNFPGLRDEAVERICAALRD